MEKIERFLYGGLLVSGGWLVGMSSSEMGWFRWASLGGGLVAIVTGLVAPRLVIRDEDDPEVTPPPNPVDDHAYWRPWPPT
jgi:hypothetical protein